MGVFPKFVKLSLALALAMVLAMASVARASHEAYAPTQVFLSEQGQTRVGANCLSLHVDGNGVPVNPQHIHACGTCVFAVDTQWLLAPPTTVLLRLQAPKSQTFEPQPPVHMAIVDQFSPHAPRAPPLFS